MCIANPRDALQSVHQLQITTIVALIAAYHCSQLSKEQSNTACNLGFHTQNNSVHRVLHGNSWALQAVFISFIDAVGTAGLVACLMPSMHL